MPHLSAVDDHEPHGDVPPDNRPGHHPDHESDRPTASHPAWRLRHGDHHVVPFELDGPVGAAARVFGVRPERDGLHLGGSRVAITYGPWRLDTSLDNVAAVSITGPYFWPKVIGPPHLSMADRGITFATNTRTGLCLRFHEPVPAIEPRGWLRHPGATVTVAGAERVAVALLEDLDARQSASK